MDADGLRSEGRAIRVIADRLNLLGAHAPAMDYRRVAAELDAHWSQDRVCPVSIAVDFLGDLVWASPDATTREAAHAEAVNHLYEAALERGGFTRPEVTATRVAGVADADEFVRELGAPLDDGRRPGPGWERNGRTRAGGHPGLSRRGPGSWRGPPG